VVTKPLLAVLLAAALTACGGAAGSGAKKAGLSPADPESDAPAAAKPAAKAAPKSGTKPGAKGAGSSGAALMPATQLPEPNAPMVRETFSYTGGSRDPFVSLLSIKQAGPELVDLTLVSILYDTRNPTQSAAVLRERVTNRRYTVKPGDRLGRMRVGEIRPKDVTFIIDDFGTERQEILTLRKQEVENQ